MPNNNLIMFLVFISMKSNLHMTRQTNMIFNVSFLRHRILLHWCPFDHELKYKSFVCAVNSWLVPAWNVNINIYTYIFLRFLCLTKKSRKTNIWDLFPVFICHSECKCDCQIQIAQVFPMIASYVPLVGGCKMRQTCCWVFSSPDATSLIPPKREFLKG